MGFPYFCKVRITQCAFSFVIHNKKNMQKLTTLLLSSLLLGAAHTAMADEVTLTTGLAVGSELNLALNANLQVTLHWGNDDEQTITGDGTRLSIPVKDASLTITSTSGKITSLYLPDNQISALNVSNCPNLRHLYAAGNSLSGLDVSKLTKLVTLDVQGNSLKTLNATNCTSLQTLNVAGNSLTSSTLKVPTSGTLENVIVANNGLTSTIATTAMKKAKNYWAQNNKITQVSTANWTQLHSLILSNNALKSLTLNNQPELTELFVDHNVLTQLNLSAGTPSLGLLAADDNKLTDITYDVNNNKAKLKFVYVDNNQLFINSLPTPSTVEDFVYVPQADYAMDEKYALNTTVDLSALLKQNGYNANQSHTIALVDREGNTLVKNTDYKDSQRKYTFLKEHVGVHFEVTSRQYSAQTFRTTSFTLGDITDGVHNATANDASFSATGTKGAIRVTTGKATPVQIVDLSGRTLYNSTVNGQTVILLNAGTYVVNGQKVIVK